MKNFYSRLLALILAAILCSCEEHNQVFQTHLAQEVEFNELKTQAKDIEGQVALFGVDPVQAGKDFEQRIVTTKAANEALELDILGLEITKRQLEQAIKNLGPRIEALKTTSKAN